MKDKLNNIDDKRLRGLFARAILDENISIEITGDHKRVRVVQAILEASRRLFHVLQNEDTSFEQVQEALTKKRHAAIHYRKLFNANWYF